MGGEKAGQGYRDAPEVAPEEMARPYRRLEALRARLDVQREDRRAALEEAAHRRAVRAHAADLEAQMGSASSVAMQVRMGGLDPSAYAPLERLRAIHREVRAAAAAEVAREVAERRAPDPRVAAVPDPTGVPVIDRRAWLIQCDEAIALAREAQAELEAQLATLERRAPAALPEHLAMAWSQVEKAVDAAEGLAVGEGITGRLRTDWQLATPSTRHGCAALVFAVVAIAVGWVVWAIGSPPVELQP